MMAKTLTHTEVAWDRMKDMPKLWLPWSAASMSVMSCRAVLLAARRSLKAW